MGRGRHGYDCKKERWCHRQWRAHYERAKNLAEANGINVDTVRTRSGQLQGLLHALKKKGLEVNGTGKRPHHMNSQQARREARHARGRRSRRSKGPNKPHNRPGKGHKK